MARHGPGHVLEFPTVSPKPSSPIIAKARRANPSRIRNWTAERVKVAAARAGFVVSRLDDESRHYVRVSHNDDIPLPPGAEATLRGDNPKLLELERAYDAFDVPATVHTQWGSAFLKRNLSMAWFRGDNAYVWQFRQLRSAARAKTYLQLLDVESRDRLGLLDKLDEDGLFGAFTFEYGDRPPASRDLIDSVNEINYLNDHIGLSEIRGLRVLDIGAGYGRLAHRMSTAFPDIAAYDCIDGVPTSTFLCDYYLKFRQVPATVRSVPITEYETLGERYDVCVNIHSFAECSLETIRWWLDRIAERDIPWLLIVPNTPPELLSTESDGSHQNFQHLVEQAGYELVDSRWTHDSDERRDLIGVYDKFFLFRRKED